MFWYRTRKKPPITDYKVVEAMRVELANEEFPEGPYGSAFETEALGKSTPWKEGQLSANAFDFENKELHEGLERDYPGEDD